MLYRIQCFPYPMEHAAKMIDPAQFKTFARKTIAKGVDVILGIKEGRSIAQSYRFDAAMFTDDQARAWMLDHGMKYSAFEKATGKMQSFITLVCQAFSKDDILSMVPKETLDLIMAKDQHPLFQAYSICHEGISNPAILGDTSKPIHWTRAAVQSIKNTMLKGIKFFAGHNSDNSTDNRESLGEIVADTEKEIDGVLHHIVIGYFPDATKVQDKDVCSQEAEWNFFEAAGNWFADTVHKITGIALSNSKIDVPAFSGAKRLGMVQAFVDESNSNKRKVRAMGDLDLTTLSVTALKAEILRRGMAPSELYTLDVIKQDRTFGKEFDAITKLDTENKAKDTKIKELELEKTKAAQTVNVATAKGRMEKLVDTMKMTDKMKAYVKGTFNENISDLTDEGLKKFVDGKITDYTKVAESLGVKETLPEQKGTETDQANKDDMTLAKNNPLLENDLELIQ